MGVEENLRVIDEIAKAVNARDWKRFDELHAESVVSYGPQSPEPTKGLAAHRQELESLIKGLPDFRGEVTRAFGQGDWVCAEATFTGTHTGPLKGPGGREIPATGKSIRLPVCFTLRIEGGKITEERNYFDVLGMMAQLGLAPQGGP